VWFAVKEDGGPSVIFVYNYQFDAWSFFSTTESISGILTVCVDLYDSIRVLLSGHPYVYDLDATKDGAAAAIRSRIVTRPFPFMPLLNWHSARKLRVVGTFPANSSISITLRTADNSYTLGTLAAAGGLLTSEFVAKGKSHLLELDLLQAGITTAAPWSLDLLELEVATAGRLREITSFANTVIITE
jgi:hypothetical protein